LEKTEEVVTLQDAIMNAIAELVEFRDERVTGHVARIEKYLRLLVNRLISEKHYPEETKNWDMAFLVSASQLHDVGKIKINETIINKKGKLTPEEFELMKGHTESGVTIIENIEKVMRGNHFLHHAKIIARSHHEKWDGSGYPYGLKGYNIPLPGRLMAIADVYDALLASRSYKKAYTHDEAAEIISQGKGTHFDPVLVDVFISVADKFRNISEQT
jgi:putative two-component system response regulator